VAGTHKQVGVGACAGGVSHPFGVELQWWLCLSLGFALSLFAVVVPSAWLAVRLASVSFGPVALVVIEGLLLVTATATFRGGGGHFRSSWVVRCHRLHSGQW
jgi:hypothetical protein